jgi:3-carboxy-cis,cis-muconate cycloisomerase
MPSLLLARAASTAAMLAVFDDAALLRAAVSFEAALARAEAAAGVIPREAAAVIARVCEAAAPPGAAIDVGALAEEAAHAGTLAIALVRRLRALVGVQDAAAAELVHYGASSQDLADTALMLQVKAAAALIDAEAQALLAALERLASRHAATPALGRTLLQGALPISFGLRVTNWLLGVDAALRRFERECAAAICVQLGGAVSTLRGLNVTVVQRLAAELGLAVPPTAWFSRRDGIAGLASALAILTGATAKIARDVALAAQGEVAEAFEPRVAGRGGSSSMAHKRNPTGCQIALSAAIRAPAQAAAILAGLPQEQERGLGGWQAEAPALATLFELSHGALAAMRGVIEALEVDTAAMRRNLAAADVGTSLDSSAELVQRALDHYRAGRAGGR